MYVYIYIYVQLSVDFWDSHMSTFSRPEHVSETLGETLGAGLSQPSAPRSSSAPRTRLAWDETSHAWDGQQCGCNNVINVGITMS